MATDNPHALTVYVCGRCGHSSIADDMIVVAESEYPAVLVGPAGEPTRHACGFLAIRCRQHVDAERSARRVMESHLARIDDRYGDYD